MAQVSPTLFTILVVCTGNICRSPLAEELLRVRLEEFGIEAKVQSAGTSAMVGHGMTAEALDVSRRWGGQGGEHTATQLTQQAIASADLVLTATREHRSAVVALHPRASRYAYTINQFVRLLPGASESQSLRTNEPSPSRLVESSHAGPSIALRALVSEIAATRGYCPPPVNPIQDDIEDPYRLPVAVYERVGHEVHSAVTEIVEAFAKATGRP